MNLQLLANLVYELMKSRRREHWSRQHLEAYQASTLQSLREYTYAHSPFYQRFHKDFKDRPLHELPVLTKAMMMEHFDDLVTDRALHRSEIESYLRGKNSKAQFLNRYWVNATSGSTGRPGIFLFDRAEWAAVVASFARAYEWAGVNIHWLKRRKIAIVASSSPWHMSTLVGESAPSWWAPTLRLAASDPIDTIIQRLNDWQPKIFVAYASMARILADEQLAGRLQIKPEAVITSSEVLTDEARRLIEAAWGKVLFNHYGTTETGGLASECHHHHGMRLYEDFVIVEVVDEHNCPVPRGVFGDKLLITVLFKRVQPLIRYELSDSVRLAINPYELDLPFDFIDAIQGRTEEMLHFVATDGDETTVHPYIFHQIMDTLAVSGWQIIQEPSRLTILLSGLRDGFDDEILEQGIQQALSKLGIAVPPIHIQRVTEIPKGNSEKTLLVKTIH